MINNKNTFYYLETNIDNESNRKIYFNHMSIQ